MKNLFNKATALVNKNVQTVKALHAAGHDAMISSIVDIVPRDKIESALMLGVGVCQLGNIIVSVKLNKTHPKLANVYGICSSVATCMVACNVFDDIVDEIASREEAAEKAKAK